MVQSSSSSSSFPHAKHGKLVIIPLDLGDLSSVQTFVGSFKKQFDRLHVLVCNAGLSGVSQSYTTTTTTGLKYRGRLVSVVIGSTGHPCLTDPCVYGGIPSMMVEQIHDQTTKDGFDLIFGTNYLGHWYLVKLLQDTLVATGNTRIVCLR